MACEHQTPRVDGIQLRGCFECEGNEPTGPSFQFTYGKEEFHGPTIQERQTEFHQANAAQGRKLGRDYDTAWKR